MESPVAILLLVYLAPVLACFCTWKKPLSEAAAPILWSEAAAVTAFFPLCALVDLVSWDWLSWGSLELEDVLLFWQGGTLSEALWLWPGAVITALVLLLRWGEEKLRHLMDSACGSTEGSGI